MPSERCGTCRKFISLIEAVRCSNCNSLHHRSCVVLPVKGSIVATWKCIECNKGEQKDNWNDTPESCTNREILEEIRAMRLDVRNLHSDISDMKAEIRCCLTRIDGLEARLVALEDLTPTQSDTTPEFSTLINQLRSDLNDRDQDLLVNDVEIRNIPVEENENPTHLVTKVAEKLGVDLEIRDIVSAERVGGRFFNAINHEEVKEPRSRAIVVRLARRDVRDALLQKARIRGTDTAGLSLQGKPQRLFINERLTRFNRKLFRLARDAARKNSWQFVWTKRGHILARQKPGEHVLRIRTENDIIEYIGPTTNNLQ